MEEEEERENPVNPKKLLSNRRQDGMAIRGQGATPSMGLSQFRGGAKSEAYEMGHHLGAHLSRIHGGAYHKQFCDGMMEGSGTGGIVLPPGYKKASYKKPAPVSAEEYARRKEQADSMANQYSEEGMRNVAELEEERKAERARKYPLSTFLGKVKNEFTDPNSVLRGEVVPMGAKIASYAQPFLDTALPGVGTALNTGFKVANYANQGAKAVGLGRKGGVRQAPAPADHLEMAVKELVGMMRVNPTHPSEPQQGLAMYNRLLKSVAERHGVSAKELAEALQGASDLHAMKGGFKSGAYEGHGWVTDLMNKKKSLEKESQKKKETKGGKLFTPAMPSRVMRANVIDDRTPKTRGKIGAGKRAPASPSSGRMKRAQIVKQVMAEKGLKMIEASKYVKEHGLY